MDESPKESINSFQALMEGNCETIIENKESHVKMNVTEILRDLYQKYYKVNLELEKLKNPEASK